jgi:flagellar operon protein
MVAGNGHVNNIYKVTTRSIPAMEKNTRVKENTAFDKILKEKIEKQGLKFSKHAELRLQSRNINLSSLQVDRIAEGINKAGAKGVKESLVLMDDMAFVVSVRNRTIVTAANKNDLDKSVFTNIDGAVIV